MRSKAHSVLWNPKGGHCGLCRWLFYWHTRAPERAVPPSGWFRLRHAPCVLLPFRTDVFPLHPQLQTMFKNVQSKDAFADETHLLAFVCFLFD